MATGVVSHNNPATHCRSLSGSDSADLDPWTRGLYCSAAGAVRVTFADMADGDSVTLSGLLAGVVYPFSVKRLWSTGTTATVFGLY